jgi:hypothetical protein
VKIRLVDADDPGCNSSRKIKLKQQARKLIRAESARLDHVQVLLNSFTPQAASASKGGCLDHPPACIPSSRDGSDGKEKSS